MTVRPKTKRPMKVTSKATAKAKPKAKGMFASRKPTIDGAARGDPRQSDHRHRRVV